MHLLVYVNSKGVLEPVIALPILLFPVSNNFALEDENKSCLPVKTLFNCIRSSSYISIHICLTSRHC